MLCDDLEGWGVMGNGGGRLKREAIHTHTHTHTHTHLRMINVVWQKQIQHCKRIIFQLKKKKLTQPNLICSKKNNNSSNYLHIFPFIMWQALRQTLYIYYLIYSNQKAYEAADIIISFFQQREYGKL